MLTKRTLDEKINVLEDLEQIFKAASQRWHRFYVMPVPESFNQLAAVVSGDLDRCYAERARTQRKDPNKDPESLPAELCPSCAARGYHP